MSSVDGNTITYGTILEVSWTPPPAETDTIGHLSQRTLVDSLKALDVAVEAVKALSLKSEPAASDTDDESSASLTEGLDANGLDLNIEIEQYKRSRSAVILNR